MNGFIPDASFVGTIFVNAISNILTTAAQNVKFNLTIPKQSPILETYIGDFSHSRTSLDDHNDTFSINLGLVRYGQSLDFAILLSKGFSLDHNLSYETNNQSFSTEVKKSADQESKSDFVEIQIRMDAILTILA